MVAVRGITWVIISVGIPTRQKLYGYETASSRTFDTYTMSSFHYPTSRLHKIPKWFYARLPSRVSRIPPKKAYREDGIGAGKEYEQKKSRSGKALALTWAGPVWKKKNCLVLSTLGRSYIGKRWVAVAVAGFGR